MYTRDLFRDQIVILIGGGSGIGRCTAHELASLGTCVAIVGRHEAKLERVRGEVESDGGSNTARLEYVHSTSRRVACSAQAKLGQQCADIPVGVDRDGPAIVVDLPDVESRDVEPATGGRDPRWEPLAGVAANHPPLLRHAAIDDIEERLTDRVKS